MKTDNKKWKFVRQHATKEALDRTQIELYIFIYKLLREELDEASRKDRTSSE